MLNNVEIENREMFYRGWEQKGRFIDPFQLPRNSPNTGIKVLMSSKTNSGEHSFVELRMDHEVPMEHFEPPNVHPDHFETKFSYKVWFFQSLRISGHLTIPT